MLALRRVARVLLLGALLGGTGCGKDKSRTAESPDAAASGALVSTPNATAPGAPKPGMVWIPPGMLRAGTPPERAPRIAEEELPGTEIPLAGFYMDVLPYPNEPGAIPMTNVARDEAAHLCETKGKRLCTELEWERACKGPENATYEYGDAYRSAPCGTGLAPEQQSRRPAGERPTCKSEFGVRDMHGSIWEWTDSPWGRGSTRDLGVIRGGNGAAGEIVGRCANAAPRPPGAKEPMVGFRCCAGPRNEARVELTVRAGHALDKGGKALIADAGTPPIAAVGNVACGPPERPAPCFLSRTWTWRPVANVELLLVGGCVGTPSNARCGLAVARPTGGPMEGLADVDTGQQVPEIVLVEGPARRVRIRGGDMRGTFFRELVYRYGRVEVRELKAN